jgi:hypothetical protein
MRKPLSEEPSSISGRAGRMRADPCSFAAKPDLSAPPDSAVSLRASNAREISAGPQVDAL